MVIVLLSASRPSCKVGKPCRRNIFCLPLFLGCNGRAIPAETWKFNYKKCSFLQLACLYKIWNVCRMTFLALHSSFVFQSMPLQYLWAISFPFFSVLIVFSLSFAVKCSRLYLFNFLRTEILKSFPSRCAAAKLKTLDFNVPRGLVVMEYFHQSWLEISES